MPVPGVSARYKVDICLGLSPPSSVPVPPEPPHWEGSVERGCRMDRGFSFLLAQPMGCECVIEVSVPRFLPLAPSATPG